MAELGNDRWTATIEPSSLGRHEFVIEAWTDRFATWRRDVLVKQDAGQDVAVELEEGVAPARAAGGRTCPRPTAGAC